MYGKLGLLYFQTSTCLELKPLFDDDNWEYFLMCLFWNDFIKINAF